MSKKKNETNNNTNKSETEKETENKEVENQNSDDNLEESISEEEKLQEKIKALEEECLKAKAEVINYKRRKDEEVSKLIKYSEENIIAGFLPILDNFERAINMDDDNLEDEVSKFLQGFKMIYCNLVGILEKYEVKEIESLNQPFDPTYHQAVMTEKREGVEPGVIIEVMQKGYMLKDKVIRPTMVKVSE